MRFRELNPYYILKDSTFLFGDVQSEIANHKIPLNLSNIDFSRLNLIGFGPFNWVTY